MRRATTLLLFFTLLLSGCGNAKWTSIYRTFDGTNSVVIDAKQRAILRSPSGDIGNRLMYVCAEPSPDALSAVSSSLATSGSFSGTHTNPKVEAAFASALQEAASQLRRGRTVQLLRDGLYRACEGYMNGALTETDYKKIAQKYADATVTLMAIEQITPGDQSPPVNVNPGSSNAYTSNNTSSTPEGPSVDPAQKDNSDSGKENSDRSTDGGKGSEMKKDKANSAREETQKNRTSPTASSQTLSFTGPQTSVTSTIAVPIEVASVVSDLVSQYLRTASQNTCIDTFSAPIQPHEIKGQTQSSDFESDRRREERRRIDDDKEYERMKALRSYCDEIFKVRKKGEESSPAPSPFSP